MPIGLFVLDMEGSGNYVVFFLLLRCSCLLNFVAGSKTVKFILRDFDELHCLGVFLVIATVDSGFQELQWFGNSAVGLYQSRLM